jgi:hypothetical protein
MSSKPKESFMWVFVLPLIIYCAYDLLKGIGVFLWSIVRSLLSLLF